MRTTFGIVNLIEDKITRFEEKPKLSDYWMNAGIYYLTKDIIQHLPKKGNIENTTFPIFAKENHLTAVKYPNAFWHSIDSHKDVEECVKNMKLIHYEDFVFKKWFR